MTDTKMAVRVMQLYQSAVELFEAEDLEVAGLGLVLLTSSYAITSAEECCGDREKHLTRVFDEAMKIVRASDIVDGEIKVAFAQ